MKTDCCENENLWGVFEYEVDMALGLWAALQSNKYTDHFVKNAIVESLVLHTRILCDILLSKKGNRDDILLDKLAPSFLSPHINELRQAYGIASDPKSPCWQFNKKLAHATHVRTESHDYTDALKKVWVPLLEILKDVNQEKAIIPLQSRLCLLSRIT